MRKAAYYARVSSDLQRKEKTIESQILELKKQVTASGQVLVKEYIDDGFSGARLDRPAMNQLRDDLKKNIFDTIYFLNTDRIARDVTYQTIIVAEILKHGKQIIINGKDYIHNPENKFTLTVLGAVSELERAKMLERVGRGKALRLAQGYLLGLGSNTYGYDYIRKTPDNPAAFVVNEKEAVIVRDIFETYATGKVGIRQITKSLENRKIPTKAGGKFWRVNTINDILKNHSYIGTKFFNKTKLTREYANPIYGIKKSKVKYTRRDRSEWIGIKIPRIVSDEVFSKVQEVIAYNKKKYRNPRHPQLLSGLIRCGICKDSFYSYRRYYKKVRADGTEKVYRLAAYKCNWRHRAHMHSDNTELHKIRCTNMEVKTVVLEERIWEMIQNVMINPEKLKECMESLHGKKENIQVRLRRRLKSIDKKVSFVQAKKQRLIDLYAAGDLEKDVYVQKNVTYDTEISSLDAKRIEIASQIPVLHRLEEVDTSIQQYCQMVRIRLQKCKDAETKRKFMLDFIEKIIYANENVAICGSVPLYDESSRDRSRDKIEFKIPGKILISDRRAKYIPYGEGGKPSSLPEYNLAQNIASN